jgi:hypothetical protein
VERRLIDTSLPLARAVPPTGSAEPTPLQRPRADLDPESLVPENVVGVVLPEFEWNAAAYQRLADQQLSTLFQQLSAGRERPGNAFILVGSLSGINRPHDQLQRVNEPAGHRRAQHQMIGECGRRGAARR